MNEARLALDGGSPVRDDFLVYGKPCIGEDEIALEFIRSSGPGGQNVNKVATAVRLRFDVRREGQRAEPAVYLTETLRYLDSPLWHARTVRPYKAL